MDYKKDSIADDEVWNIEVPKDEIIQETEKLKREIQKYVGFFKIQSANEWIDEAEGEPVDKMLFDCFWYEGELCVLFSSSNLGKSILGYQIADSITKGKKIEGFRIEAEGQPVLYFDFELNKKKFRKRYTQDNQSPYKFHESLKRIEMESSKMTESDVEGYDENTVLERIEQVLTQTDVKVLIVDNMSYMIRNNEKAKDATSFLFKLNILKSKHKLSILVLGHTPKREFEKPLSLMDLAGSAAMGNFIDSAFAIGKVSQNVGERYIKQVKQRDSEEVYHSENVCIMKIEKVDSFLQMRFQDYGIERELLKKVDGESKEELIQKVKDLHTMGKSVREIKEICNIAQGTVSKYINM